MYGTGKVKVNAFQRSHVYASNRFFKLSLAHKLTSQTILMTDRLTEKKLSRKNIHN